MTTLDIRIQDQIRHNHQKGSTINNYMEIQNRDLDDFELISHTASLKYTDIPREENIIEDLARHIGKDLADKEFKHFTQSMTKIIDNTTKTTIENLSNTFDDVYNNLEDQGYPIDLYFVPFLLNREIQKQKNITIKNGVGIVSNLINIQETGKNQIFLASKHNFKKIYPKSSETINVTIDRILHHPNHAEINCSINQKLEIINEYMISKIIVIDSERHDNRRNVN